jgi:hypothetical protein
MPSKIRRFFSDQNMSHTPAFSPACVADLGTSLNAHPLYAAVQNLDDLRVFMAHHIYSVWDFMSLLKCLQGHIAPTAVPWTPRGSAEVRFFINQIVVGEECDDGLPDVAGAAFALGREHIIPAMFRALLAKMGIDAKAAPAFHFYLERHIHLDEDFHAPLALRMVNELVGGVAVKLAEAQAAARVAVQARIAFWDGVKTVLGK